jgi:hypothetical protein
VTERFTRAVDQLGHESLDVRLGGIYALERITRDSERDRSTMLGSLEPIGAVVSRSAMTEQVPFSTQSYPRTGWVTGATSGPHSLRASGTTAVTSGPSTPQLSSFLRSAPQVLGPPRFALAWRRSPGSQSVVGR